MDVNGYGASCKRHLLLLKCAMQMHQLGWGWYLHYVTYHIIKPVPVELGMVDDCLQRLSHGHGVHMGSWEVPKSQL